MKIKGDILWCMKGVVIGTVVAVVAIIGLVYYFNTEKPASAEVQEFAQCIADSGATYYGAFWCPNCQEQGEMFGSAENLLPYVECSLPSGQGQTEVCADAGIEGYPTWEFADGSRVTGRQPFSVLAEKTSCEEPSIQ